MTNVIAILKDQAKKAARHNEAAKTLCGRLEKGFALFRPVQPQPSLGLQRCDNADYLRVENCAFCDLGFNPIWTARTASCQHLYHDSYCRFVFETSTTCVAAACGTKMHEGWWAFAGLIKPGESANQVNPTEMFSGQTSTPQPAGEFFS